MKIVKEGLKAYLSRNSVVINRKMELALFLTMSLGVLLSMMASSEVLFRRLPFSTTPADTQLNAIFTVEALSQIYGPVALSVGALVSMSYLLYVIMWFKLNIDSGGVKVQHSTITYINALLANYLQKVLLIAITLMMVKFCISNATFLEFYAGVPSFQEVRNMVMTYLPIHYLHTDMILSGSLVLAGVVEVVLIALFGVLATKTQSKRAGN